MLKKLSSCICLLILFLSMNVSAQESFYSSNELPIGPEKSTKLQNSLFIFTNAMFTLYNSNQTAGRYRISLRVKSTQANGIGPILEVIVNDVPIGKKEIKSDEFIVVSWEADLLKSTNRLTFKFDNDYYDVKTKKDRNLFIQSIIVELIGARLN